MTHAPRSCPGCKKDHPPTNARGAIGRAARDMDAFPSLSEGGTLHYLCMICAHKACELARQIAELHGGDYDVYLRGLAMSDPVPGDPFREFPLPEGA